MLAADQARVLLTFQASQRGELDFGQVVRQLMDAHIESYQVDFRTERVTCYSRSADTLDIPLESAPHVQNIACNFDAFSVQEAIRGAQEGRVLYPEFQRLVKTAGCIGYTVWIDGKSVAYYGRLGERHVERFPTSS